MFLNLFFVVGVVGVVIVLFVIKDLIVAFKSSIFVGAFVGNSVCVCGMMLKNWFVIVFSVCDVIVFGLNIVL